MGRNWTFGRKLGLGLTAKALLTLTLAVVAIWALRHVIAAKDEVITNNARLLTDAYKLRASSLERIGENRGYLLTGDEKFREGVAESRQKSLEILADMTSRIHTEEERNLLGSIHQASDAQAVAGDRVMQMRKDSGTGTEKLPDIIQAFQGEVVGRNQDFNRVLGQFADLEEKNLDSAKAKASEIAGTAIIVLIAFAIASVLVAIVLAAVLTRALSRQIGSAVQHIQSSSSELQAAANQQTAGAKEQVASMTEISATIKELMATAKQIADSAQGVARIADSASEGAGSGDQTVGRAQAEISTIRTQVDLVVEHMLDLGKKSQQIGGILEIINELAEQTNILAINATIEAAGAGESGKRFAVVADEIRKLADRVGGSTKEIRTLIDQIRAAVNTAVMATESGSKAVDAGTRQFGEVTAVFRQIADLLRNTNEAAREIELSTKQQSTAVEQVNVAVANVAQAARESEASSSQVLQTVAELTALSRDLGRLIQPQGHA